MNDDNLRPDAVEGETLESDLLPDPEGDAGDRSIVTDGIESSDPLAMAETPECAELPEGTEAEKPESGEEAVADPRLLELVKGIHAELLCHCPECEPDFVELQWFSPEEKKKIKGTAMLYCQRSSRKYFTPVGDLTAWIATKPVVKGRARAEI